MKERNTCIDKVKEETKEQMMKQLTTTKNNMYKGAIKNLIIQVRFQPYQRRYDDILNQSKEDLLTHFYRA